jgi:hypothetical protein
MQRLVNSISGFLLFWSWLVVGYVLAKKVG